MELTTFIPALLFGLLGLFLIVFIATLLARALFGDWRSFTAHRRLKQRQAFVNEARNRLEAGDESGAFAILQQCFLLDHIRVSEGFVSLVHDHHLTVLGLLIGVADKKAASIPNLPVLDELLQIRTAMLRAYLETDITRLAINQRRANKGRETPQWAEHEFDKKLTELTEKLTTNRKSIESELEKLFEALAQIGSPREVTYH